MMTKSELPQQPHSISSGPTDSSAQSDAILALGRKLVDELELEPSNDTLGRWMAHYISDLIRQAEAAVGEARQSVEKECFDAILALWKHRAELPNGKRPFQGLEPVLRTIESLDPDDDTPRYFRNVRPPKGEKEEKSDAETWLDMVIGLDYSAKILISYCLAEAAQAETDKSKEWVKLAEAAGEEDGVPEIVVRFVSTSADHQKEPDIHGELRRQIQDRLKRLEGFTRLAETFVGHLKARLEELPKPETSADEMDDHIVLSAQPPFG